MAPLAAWLFLLPLIHAQDSGSTGSSGGTGSGGDTGSTGGNTMTWDTGTTQDLGGGTLTLAQAIFNGGTVTNGTISASSFTGYSGQVGAVLAGTGNFAQQAGGTTTLSAANTYTGTTSINGGTLQLAATGSLAGTSSIRFTSTGAVFDVSAVAGYTVGSGQTLGSNGARGTVIGAPTFGSGATFGFGNGGGATTFASGVTFASGSILNLAVSNTVFSDQIRLTGGTLTGPSGTGGITLNVANSANDFAAGTFTVFDFTTAGVALSNFDVTDFTLGTTLPGYTYSLAISGNTLQLTASAIPEPGTYAVLAGVLALAGAFFQRRRRAQALKGSFVRGTTPEL